MIEDLKGRVRDVNYDRVKALYHYRCRAPTLDGRAVDFEFTLNSEDERAEALMPGSRVTYSSPAAGVHGTARVPGFDDKPVVLDRVRTTRVPSTSDGPASFREGLLFEAVPSLALMKRMDGEARRMGYEIAWGNHLGTPFVEVTVPGRGKMRHHKDIAETWEEVLDRAGLGGTLQ